MTASPQQPTVSSSKSTINSSDMSQLKLTESPTLSPLMYDLINLYAVSAKHDIMMRRSVSYGHQMLSPSLSLAPMQRKRRGGKHTYCCEGKYIRMSLSMGVDLGYMQVDLYASRYGSHYRQITDRELLALQQSHG